MAMVQQQQQQQSGSKSNKNVATAMAIAGRASRACDVCGSQRARWYCHADNAHLCHLCDQNVHSANALAQRHERVRLSSTAGVSSSAKERDAEVVRSPPSRKRSRSSRKPNPHVHAPGVAVAKATSKANSAKRKAELLTDSSHEVPNFITVNIQESQVSFATHDSATAMSMAEFCKVHAAAAAASTMQQLVDVEDAFDQAGDAGDADQFLVPSGYLDDFESAIAAPIDSTSPSGSPSPDDDDDEDESYRFDFSDIVADAFEGEVTVENDEEEFEEEEEEDDQEEEEQQQQPAPLYRVKQECYNRDRDTYDLIKKEVAAVLEESKPFASSLLRLDYADVLSAWSEHRSLWTEGKRPQTVPDDSISEAAGVVLDVGVVPDMHSGHGCHGAAAAGGGDGYREARVMRYREKRRTRLFSKKIRYEVRKLNAERRPRMKGRFVKRTPGMCSS